MTIHGDQHQRQNVGRLDRVEFAYFNLQNLEEARSQFSTFLGIKDWEEFDNVESGVHVVVSWSSTFTLLCPTELNTEFSRKVSQEGEGFYALVYGVSDLDVARADLAKQGIDSEETTYKDVPQSISSHFATAREAKLASPVGGINVILGEFEPRVMKWTPSPGQPVDLLK